MDHTPGHPTGPGMSHMTTGRMNDPALQQCIQDCLDCHSICLVTASHCLHLGGPHAEVQHLQVLFDCAEVCRTSANFMLRRSDLYDWICTACAEVCAWCARTCARQQEDPQMRACAEVCQRCAASCQAMSNRTLRDPNN